jgi:hypothetical protein
MCGLRRLRCPSVHGQTAKLPVLVMVAGYSRVFVARMLPSRQAPNLIYVHWQLLQRLGASPAALVWGNEAASVIGRRVDVTASQRS